MVQSTVTNARALEQELDDRQREGSPKDTRIPVTLILDARAAGDTVDDLLRGYPTLTREDIAAALAYGAKLAHERILPLARAS